MEFKVKVKKNGQLKQLKLSAAQYRELGGTMIRAMKKRISQGINIQGSAAKPLSPKYARIKARARHTRHPIRDMNLTGMTLRSFEVTRAYGGLIRAEPTGAEAKKRAFFSQRREELIGFTSYEEAALVSKVERLYGRNASVMWESR